MLCRLFLLLFSASELVSRLVIGLVMLFTGNPFMVCSRSEGAVVMHALATNLSNFVDCSISYHSVVNVLLPAHATV